MKARLRLLGLAVALLAAQQFFAWIAPEEIRPDLVLVFSLALGLRTREIEGLLLAFAAGFAVDVVSGAPQGLNALLHGTACAVTRLVDRALYLRAPVPWGIYVCAYGVVHAVLVGVALSVFTNAAADVPWGELARRAPGTALSTALAGLAAFGLLARIDTEPEREGLAGVRARP